MVSAGGRVPGQRHVKTSKKTSKNHGGKRVKLEYNLALDEVAMHADFKSLLDDTTRDTTSFLLCEMHPTLDSLNKQL